MSDGKPSTAIQQSATNPNGQASTMSGAAVGHMAPSTPLITTPNIRIDPCCQMGGKMLEKK